uniref:Uncharacterized protein n=1 Tax=Meleagris gallopavo TaxID=9103 RepID=A0A803Y6C3_MELGA
PCTYCMFYDEMQFLNILSFLFDKSAKALRLIQQKIFPYLLFKFYKFDMVGVKENIVNCTILLTPKSNFFCLVYLDFSVCFVVKQPTRVVVHKTAFES